MKLDEYLELHDLNAAQFSRKIGVCPMTISKLLNTEKDLWLSIAVRIEKYTEGQVRPHELISESLCELPEKTQIAMKRKRKT